MNRNYYVEQEDGASSLEFLSEDEDKEIKIIILEAGRYILYFAKPIYAIKILWGNIRFMRHEFGPGQAVSARVCGLLEGLSREVTCAERSMFYIEY
ncbi:MAG: hypothetical protein WA055_00055 [Candidatus Moraniibacteriota bacterium]